MTEATYPRPPSGGPSGPVRAAGIAPYSPVRWAFVMRLPCGAPGLVLALLLVLFSIQPAGMAWGQAGTPNVAELRQIIALRDARGGDNPDAAVAAAQAYLTDHADGRYVDEVLLALAQAQARLEHPELALQAYNRLIEQHPDSPFREQALVESLPLLRAQGDQAGAFARVDDLVTQYPRSLQRTPALLWKAETLESQGDHQGALTTLERLNPQEDLAGQQEARYYRLQTLALIGQGESAWTPLQRYLKRDDAPEQKAEVLMIVAGVAREAERPDEALRFYRTVVEDYPVAPYVGEALYWRAALFAKTRLDNAPEEVRAARRETALGYYSAYLGSGNQVHRAQALVGRAALHHAAGRDEEALADYDAAVQADPGIANEPGVVQGRVAVYQALGRPKEAVALLESLRRDPKLAGGERTALQVQQAALHYEAKQCKEVEALLNPMPIIADPQLRPRAFFMRGFCRYQQGQWEKATFDLEGLINDPHYQDLALPPLLEAYEQSGQYSRLVNLAEELLQAKRVQPDASLMLRLASAYASLGEPALMLSAYQRLEPVDPAALRQPAVQLRMGQAREELGQADAALKHYRAVLEPPEGEEPAPPDVYLTALEHYQALALRAGKVEGLAALHASAAKRISEPAHKQRLAALKRDLAVGQARKALEDGRPQDALPVLTEALKATPVSQPERRARVVALLVASQAMSNEPAAAGKTWVNERKAHGEPAYRAQLATATLALVRDNPAMLQRRKARDVLANIYTDALADLPPEQSDQRYQAAQALDAVYKEQGDHAARAALVTLLLKDGYDADTKQALHAYQGEIYRDWGQALLEKDDLEGAQFQLERSLEATPAEDWRKRYDRIALLSRVYLKRKEYSQLIQRNEAMLPRIEDPALAGQVRAFVGQVYLQWAKEAEAEQNPKSTRVRYGYALDYLPEDDLQRRLAATVGWAKALLAEGRAQDATAAYEAILPRLEGETRRQYALYLGRLYAERVKNPAKAAEWFQVADAGGKDPLSLEAGYLAADVELGANKEGAALKRLQGLAGRGLDGTQWAVPIHYRIAVLQHQRKALKEALKHYRVVASTKNKQARKLYPRSIQQSREKAAQIEAFLKAGGGRKDIAVPQVRPD